METHSCSSHSCWLHCSDQSLSVPDYFFLIYLFFSFCQRAKRTLMLKKRIAPSSLWCVCLYIEPHCWSQRGQRDGVVLLKSTTPICLSVRCLAWLSSTQWWCWQNDRGGGHTPVNVNLAAKHRSAGAPTHQKREKKDRAGVCRRNTLQNWIFT